MKILLFLVGLAGGAAGAASWLLSEPPIKRPLPLPEELQTRVKDLQVRFDAALAEGKQQRTLTEDRLKRELDVYRSSPDRHPR